MAVLVDVKLHLTVVWVFVSLMICDAEHLFLRLLTVCVSSLEKRLF